MTHKATHHRVACPGRQAFSLIEVLVVAGIVLSLVALLLPIIGMLKESSRKQQARRVVAQLEMGVREYASEDPTRSPPPQDADTFIRLDPMNLHPHLINALTAMQMDSGLQTLVIDQGDPQLKTLVDPWRRPYRYQLDNVGVADPTQKAVPTRPDPNRLDWNARNLVPFGYVWSLGPPLRGHAAQWLEDPDANPAANAPWIYSATAPQVNVTP